MTIPSDPSFVRIPNTVQEALKGYRTSRKVLTNGITDVRNTTKFVNKQRLENIKLTKDLKKVSDTVLDKIPGGSALAKAGKAGLALGGIAVGLGVFGIVLADLYWLKPLLQKAQDSFNDSIAKDLSKTLTQITINRSKIKNLELSDQRTRDRVYKVEKTLEPVKKQANDALYETREGRKILEGKILESRKLGNDALYETREGRKILEGKILESRKLGNDALYETREGRKLIDSLLSKYNELASSIKQGLGDSINTTINNLKSQIESLKSKAAEADKKNESQDLSIKSAVEQTKALSQAFDKVPKGSDLLAIKGELDLYRNSSQSQIDALGAANATLAGSINGLASNDAKLAASIDKVSNKVATPDLSPLQKELDDKFKGFVTQNNKDLNIRDLKLKDLTKSELSKEFDKKIADFEKLSNLSSEKRFEEFKKENDASLTKSELSKEFDKKIADFEKLSNLSSEKRFEEFQKENQLALNPKINDLKKTDTSLKGEIDDLNQQLKKVGTDIKGLDTKIKEREKVDIEANEKLDKMIPLVSGIPFIPAKVVDTIKPNIPTLPQINNEVGKAVCNSFNGGCGKAALDKQAAQINNSDKVNNNDLFNKLNAGANAGLLAGQQEILKRIGNFIPGGLSGKLIDGFKWLQVDRALNILTFGATVHNAAMLSNDILQTLIGAMTNVLTLIIPKDDAGNAFNIGEAINGTVESVVKGIVGEENYTNLTNAWAKANRIYQATTNVLNNVFDLGSTITNALEIVGGQQGLIGNALRLWGVVGEKAYNWMNPSPSYDNQILIKLEKLNQTASTVQMVTQVPLDVISSVNNLTESATELVKAVNQDEGAKDGIKSADAKKVKAENEESKNLIESFPEINLEDIFNAND
ncbi:hypothetical protein [Anabaena sp. PCC 7108]|uniref:hypothetical protein n=1 Tax=Anabaena sp. PCC 7108 TaxID=163908 RepID=UPI00034C19B8|nr:hypothetical protein [Anabaena sp. PCC 7108]